MPLSQGAADGAAAARTAVLLAIENADPGAIALAVSGGGDSVALLHLAHSVAAGSGRPLHAVTVDHGLRAESAHEAARVAAICKALGVPHDTLRWEGWDGQGNLQARARAARYALIADWARAQGIGTILLGHTRDDQAETFLMRLARTAGVDGLSGMAARFPRNGVTWCRPLLGTDRATLRAFLRGIGADWIEDPSNDDSRFERVRARAALAALAPLGIDAATLARVSQHMDEARDALDACAAGLSQSMVRQDHGDLVVDWDGLAAHPLDLRRRILVAALVWIGTAAYPPRREDILSLLAEGGMDGQRTLMGCILRQERGGLRIFREFNAVRDLRCATDAVWDGRWRLEGPHDPALCLAALGEAGLRLCPDWRETGRARASLLASPAIWRGDRLVAAPLAGWGQGWIARIVADFHDTALSH